MQLPTSAFGATGRALEALRQHTVLPAIAAHDAVLRPSATARALADISAAIGHLPETLIRKFPS